MTWSRSDVVPAVRSALTSYPPDSWTFEAADLDEDQLLVVFKVADARYGVHYSLADLPDGPSTGEPCDTAERWAFEVKWDMDENVETGGVGRAERVPGPDGVVLLRWQD